MSPALAKQQGDTNHDDEFVCRKDLQVDSFSPPDYNVSQLQLQDAASQAAETHAQSMQLMQHKLNQELKSLLETHEAQIEEKVAKLVSEHTTQQLAVMIGEHC